MVIKYSICHKLKKIDPNWHLLEDISVFDHNILISDSKIIVCNSSKWTVHES